MPRASRSPPETISDDQIYRIAEDIRHAVHRGRSDDVSIDILSIRSQLPRVDEDRVMVALDVLHLLDEVAR